MKFNVALVDPKKAEMWLQKNTKNRRLQRRQIEKLAAEMAAGRWVLNGDTIKFSSDGRLIDGQHRLHAVIKSGATVQMAIALEVDDPNAFKTIDVNALGRSAHQIAEMMGIKSANSVAAAARRLLHWENTPNKGSFTFSNEAWKVLSVAEVVDYADAHQDEISAIHSSIAGSLPFRRCGAGSALTSALVLCNRADEVATMIFIDSLKSGTNLMEHSPVAILRDRLIAPPDRRGIWWDLELMALTIKSFNKLLYSKPLKVLRWLPNEKFPTPGDAQ